MPEIWKTVSTRIKIDDYNALMEIARREGKTESELLRLTIETLFQQYPVYDMLKALFTSGALEKIEPLVIDALISALQKGFEIVHKEYKEAEQRNSKLEKLTTNTVKEFKNTLTEISSKQENFPFETNEQKNGILQGSVIRRPEGINELNSMKEIKKIESKDTLKQIEEKIANLERERDGIYTLMGWKIESKDALKQIEEKIANLEHERDKKKSLE
ncbi:MAG: hypothetical protein EX285_04200 [Thaumarchaeota archaeon]|nr:hypothetical protein [Nitrososphaerota archaeon]